jgi:predicted transposase/invertase (TIGR01784 family)
MPSLTYSRYLDPKVDLPFKRVFGEHANLLKSFLNALLPLPEDGLIDTLEYLTPEQVPELPGLFKNSIVDVKCHDTKGRTFIVEMQMLWSASFEQRILFAASQAYVKQLGVGQNYSELGQVYALAITNQIFEHHDEDYYHHYQIVKTKKPERILKGLEFVFIEIPKFKPKTRTDKLMQVKWLRFLSEVGKDDAQLNNPAYNEWRNDPEIAQALSLVEVGAFTPMELESYHMYQDRARIEPTMLADAKAEGLAEGKAAGKAEGLAEGAHQAALTIAKSLLNLIPNDVAIATATGLLVSEIAALRQMQS